MEGDVESNVEYEEECEVLYDAQYKHGLTSSEIEEETRQKKKARKNGENSTGVPDIASKKEKQHSRASSTAGKKQKFVSTRKYFHKGGDCYVMDAKCQGNIGRYINHSCNPNVFVQNCFEDTHDHKNVF